MSQIDRKELLEVLAKSARRNCPVLPTQDMKAFGTGKIVGRAEGVARLFKELELAEIIDEDEILTLSCILSNRDKEEVLEEKRQHEEMMSKMNDLESEEGYTQQ